MKQFFQATPKPEVTVDGTETFSVNIDWRNGHRDKVKVIHFPVSGPTPTTTDGNETVVDMSKAQVGELLVEGRSMNDLMKSFAQFLDYDLEISDDGFCFKLQKGAVN